jgi:hypothetical protein
MKKQNTTFDDFMFQIKYELLESMFVDVIRNSIGRID